MPWRESLRGKDASYLPWQQVYVDEAGVMLLDVAGRGLSVRCRYVAPLAHGKDQLHPLRCWQFRLKELRIRTPSPMLGQAMFICVPSALWQWN